jgi:cytochrome o ubiquinol oxidase subunit 2
MTFTAKSAPQPSFDKWVQSAQRLSKKLDITTYEQLAKPSESNPVAYYSSVQPDLYSDIMMQYMMPDASLSNSGTQQ